VLACATRLLDDDLSVEVIAQAGIEGGKFASENECTWSGRNCCQSSGTSIRWRSNYDWRLPRPNWKVDGQISIV